MRAACEELADVREQEALTKLGRQLERRVQIRKQTMQFRKQLRELGRAWGRLRGGIPRQA